MRKLNLLIGAAVLVTASVSTTLYIVNHPMRPKSPDAIAVGVQVPETVISPGELLSEPVATPAPGETSASVAAETARSGLPSRAYILYRPQWQNLEAHVEGAQPVTESGGYIRPVWSPVGLDIAFTRDGFKGVYLAGPVPGGNARLLIPDEGSGNGFVWNPDGMSMRAPTPDGEVANVLITGERYPASKIRTRVFVKNDIVYFQPEEGDKRQISGLEDRFVEPVLSPDENLIVYRGVETGLYIAGSDGIRAMEIGPGVNPSWLPDSSGIVYNRPVSDGTSIVDGDLWYATADGQYRVNLTQTPGIVESHPAVAPDGEKIAFSAGGSIYAGKLIRETPPASPKK